jgi:3-oxoacyl-(acyl-carrier-protein) synthase
MEAIYSGRRGLRPLRRLAGVDCLTEVAGEVSEELVRAAAGNGGLAFHLARLAGEEALAEAGPRRPRTALILASTKANLGGVSEESSEHPGLGLPIRLAKRLAKSLELDGPVAAVSCACASGLAALAMAGRWLARDQAEQVLVLGVDALDPFILRGFSALMALDPGPCRPFDTKRQGLSLGEGAGAILLDKEAPPPLGRIRLAGWGESNDANHITGPSRDGRGLCLAMQRALEMAGLEPAQLDYIHLHGTGTPYNDAMECAALELLYAKTPEGERPVASGSKSQLGHCLGAAGLLESLVAIEALLRKEAPANVGLEQADPVQPILLAREPQPLARARTALKLAAGFGGINAALVWEAGA